MDPQHPSARGADDLFAKLAEQRRRRALQSRALWAMSPAQREAAMWRGELTAFQLREWARLAPSEVPVIGGELPWIAAFDPDYCEADDS